MVSGEDFPLSQPIEPMGLWDISERSPREIYAMHRLRDIFPDFAVRGQGATEAVQLLGHPWLYHISMDYYN